MSHRKHHVHADMSAQTLQTVFVLFPQDKKDFIEKRVKRLLKAGVISALAVMVKADSAILTDQTKEMLAR